MGWPLTWSGAPGPEEDQFAQAGESRGVEGAIPDIGSGSQPVLVLPVIPAAVNWRRPEDS